MVQDETIQRAGRESLARAPLAACWVLLGTSLGLVIGFWASEFGARFVPQTAAAALVLALVGFAVASVGLAVAARRFDLRARTAASACGLTLIGLVLVLAVEGPTALTDLPDIELRRVQELDARYYRDLDRTLRGLVLSFESAMTGTAGSDDLLTPEDEALALDIWQSYLDTAVALDRVRDYHEDFYRFDLSRSERAAHVRSFLVSFACELSLYENTKQLMQAIRSRPNVTRFLNLGRPDRGLAVDTVAYVDEELTGLTDLSRISAGRRYLDYLDTFHEGRALIQGEGLAWLWSDVERYVSAAESRSTRRSIAASATSDFAPILRGFKHISFPVQREVAEWMGDTRLKRTGSYLIPRELVLEVERELEPGDLLLARKNWYLSNVGLPGFWPHAMLYVGRPEAIASAFDEDPDVLLWVRRAAGREMTFSEWLAETYPVAWSQKIRSAESEESLALIEAVSEGVVQSALSHASGDFLVAFRPRVPAVARARAIYRAFAFLDRPYDFDFDFATDDALVCTEVVWRAYRPESRGDEDGHLGLRLEPVTIAGRATLPANDLARLAATERGPERQLDFLFYIAGDEAAGSAALASFEAFTKTTERSKWSR